MHSFSQLCKIKSEQSEKKRMLSECNICLCKARVRFQDSLSSLCVGCSDKLDLDVHHLFYLCCKVIRPKEVEGFHLVWGHYGDSFLSPFVCFLYHTASTQNQKNKISTIPPKSSQTCWYTLFFIFH